MSTVNLGELIKGLMAVIGIALSLGKLPELKQWAAREAFGVHSPTSENMRKTRGKISENHRKCELTDPQKLH